MAVHPRPNNRSFMNVVSDIAFGARTSKSPDDDGNPRLNEVLTELEVSERESDDLYMPSLAVVEEKPPVTLASEPVPKAQAKASPTPQPPISDETLKRADGHRQRMEKLLNEARQIEEMIAKEAAEATALADRVNLEEKRAASAQAAENELQAITRANELAQRRASAIAEHTQVAAEVRVTREAVDAATASVAELQTRLAEAQKNVTQAKFKLREHEGRLEKATALVDQVKVEAHNADRRAAKCSEVREAAEAELHHAEEVASSIAVTTEALEKLRALSGSRAK